MSTLLPGIHISFFFSEVFRVHFPICGQSYPHLYDYVFAECSEFIVKSVIFFCKIMELAKSALLLKK